MQKNNHPKAVGTELPTYRSRRTRQAVSAAGVPTRLEHVRTSRSSRVRDYAQLIKPEITFLVVISALAGFVLASTDGISGWTLFWALIGISLTSAGGSALNHYQERDLDAQMKRTAARPLPSGRIRPETARNFGYILVASGLAILCPLCNPLTGALAAVAVVLYLYVYTPLKRVTPYNTLIGTIPGALPALGGWTAATGNIGAGGLAIFAVLVFWQMPHFMSLAWMYRKDYERAGYRMWTIDDADGKKTIFLTVLFSIAMVLASLLPVVLSLSGLPYLIGASVLGFWFMLPVVRFARSKSVRDARAVLKASVLYIPLLLLLIVADRLTEI